MSGFVFFSFPAGAKIVRGDNHERTQFKAYITSLQVGTVINEGDYLLLSESVYYYWNNGKKNNSLAGNTLYRVGIDEGSFYFAIDNGTTYVIDAEGKTKLKVVSGTGTSDNVFRFSVTD